ncbi:hypothetical protein [Neobacillus massiliamazoniensis]|uniref:Uncharacterized protein n=1 Tax=Neobacillus massiliamazoniensis TaxID=1499688 RepID=A0A0U1NZ52_9BACI|nr:hypothetical protein [Neobacillus massiliamazoniensis]CRK83273.1 hypothetical protein BN000_03236 [Neobacillus massiliamazoniensis]
MKWIMLLGITVCLVLISLFEWQKLTRNQKKEKATLVTLTTMGWFLAILLVFFPEMPGPTQMIDKLFKPFGKLLEK